MKIESLITSWEEYKRVRDALIRGKGPVLLTGGAQIHKAQFLAALCREQGRGALLLTQDEQSALRLCEEINLFLGEPLACHYPERELTLAEVEGISLPRRLLASCATSCPIRVTWKAVRFTVSATVSKGAPFTL